MKNKLKNNILDGLRIGLKSFSILYTFSIIVSLILNLTLIEHLKDIMLGTVGGELGFSFSLLMKIAAFIMNISFFHSTGDMNFGFIAFVILPFVAFLLSMKYKKDFSLVDNALRYMVSSLLISVLLLVVSFILSGDVLGVNIDFVSLRNFLVSFFLSFIIQMMITFKRHLDSFAGVYLTKNFIKYSLIFSTVASFIGVVFFVSKYIKNVLYIFVLALAVVPNLAVYLFFAMFGAPLVVSDQMKAYLGYVGINVNILEMPITVRMVLIAFLIVIIVLTFMSKGEKISIKSLIGFAVLSSIFCLSLAFITYIDVGNMIKFIDARLYIDSLAAFILPFTYITGFSLVYLLVLKVSK